MAEKGREESVTATDGSVEMRWEDRWDDNSEWGEEEEEEDDDGDDGDDDGNGEHKEKLCNQASQQKTATQTRERSTLVKKYTSSENREDGQLRLRGVDICRAIGLGCEMNAWPRQWAREQTFTVPFSNMDGLAIEMRFTRSGGCRGAGRRDWTIGAGRLMDPSDR